MVAALIVLGVMVVGALVLGIVVFRMMQDPEVRKFVSAAREGMSVYVDAAQAPGAAELRALGCRDAMVVDTERLATIVERLNPDASVEVPADDEALVSPLLVCLVDGASKVTCPQIVVAYVKAVPDAPEQMLAQVVIRSRGQDRVRCGGSFQRDGTLIRSMDGSALPPGGMPSDEPQPPADAP